MEIENVSSKHIVLALKVKSILVPYQDKNNDIERSAWVLIQCQQLSLQIHIARYTYTLWVLMIDSAAGDETSQRTEFLQKKGSDGISEEDWYVVMLHNVLRMV
ncbi:hypothetical protein MKX03_013362, partial [Papaver bracteatum]